MKISILSPDLSNNCLGRAYLLAKILQKRYEVEIIGPMFGESIWQPIADDKTIIYKPVKISGGFKAYFQILRLYSKISGDIIYVSKPFFIITFPALLKKFFKNIPIIFDIDDWEMGFIKESFNNMFIIEKFKYWIYTSFKPYVLHSYLNNTLGIATRYLCNEITISNSFLQKRFGGTIIWHARDTNEFSPEKFSKDAVRKIYNINKDKKVIIFFGSLTSNKGIENLIGAIKLLNDENVVLMLVGVDYNNFYSLGLLERAERELSKGQIIKFGFQPFNKVPEFLAMADIVVIPQKRNFATIGQLPAKLFDAMAMAKPIIATNVNDLPQILDKCGWIVEPNNSEQLAKTIQYVLENPDKAKKMGQIAREKCIKKYSLNAVSKKLLEMFKKYEK